MNTFSFWYLGFSVSFRQIFGKSRINKFMRAIIHHNYHVKCRKRIKELYVNENNWREAIKPWTWLLFKIIGRNAGPRKNFRQSLIVKKIFCNLFPALLLLVRNLASGGSHSFTGSWKLLKVKNFDSVFVLWLICRNSWNYPLKIGFDLEWLTDEFLFCVIRIDCKRIL